MSDCQLVFERTTDGVDNVSQDLLAEWDANDVEEGPLAQVMEVHPDEEDHTEQQDQGPKTHGSATGTGPARRRAGD